MEFWATYECLGERLCGLGTMTGWGICLLTKDWQIATLDYRLSKKSGRNIALDSFRNIQRIYDAGKGASLGSNWEGTGHQRSDVPQGEDRQCVQIAGSHFRRR